ncbi:MAG: DUF1579 family protein [Phycisphaerales bacterium]
MILPVVFALATSASIAVHAEPGSSAPPASPASASDASKPAAASPVPPAVTAPGASTTGSTLSNLVAEAIKRKLDKVNANKGAPIELPPKSGAAADGPVPLAPASGGVRPESSMMSDSLAAPAAVESPVVPAARAVPDAGMLTGGARMMIGAPTDGSPSYIRVAPEVGKQNAESAKPAAPFKDNPLARSTDPMEAGSDSGSAVSEPGANHNLLDVFVGAWDVTANFDTGPGQPPETASGTMTNSWALGGAGCARNTTAR